jgi:hypothetical protein
MRIRITLLRIRILLLVKVIRICDYWYTSVQTLQGSNLNLQSSVQNFEKYQTTVLSHEKLRKNLYFCQGQSKVI